MAKARITGATRLRCKLEELGITQLEVGQRVAASATAVSRWLAGEKTPSLEMACRIEKEFGIPVEAWRAP